MSGMGARREDLPLAPLRLLISLVRVTFLHVYFIKLISVKTLTGTIYEASVYDS